MIVSLIKAIVAIQSRMTSPIGRRQMSQAMINGCHIRKYVLTSVHLGLSVICMRSAPMWKRNLYIGSNLVIKYFSSIMYCFKKNYSYVCNGSGASSLYSDPEPPPLVIYITSGCFLYICEVFYLELSISPGSYDFDSDNSTRFFLPSFCRTTQELAVQYCPLEV